MMMRKLVLAVALVALVAMVAVSATSEEAPKIIAKTTYDVKWVQNQATGKLEERKTPRKALFQVVNKKTTMPDPTNPSQTITIDVPTEVPYTPNKKATGKLAKLKAQFQSLKRRETELKFQLSQAGSKLVDFPVVEDGAPRRPDRQEQKMAQDLYDELEATQLPKAKNIKEDDLRKAAEFAKGAGATREATWDLFNEMRKKKLIPSHGWGMTM